MTSDTTTRLPPQAEIEAPEHFLDNWFDPIEAGLRGRVREFLQALLEAELDEALGRSRYGRRTQLANDVLDQSISGLDPLRSSAESKHCAVGCPDLMPANSLCCHSG